MLKISEIIAAGESHTVDFKASCAVAVGKVIPESALIEEVLITVLGFWNADGGTLLVGVSDQGEIVGIERDLRAKKSADGLVRWVSDKLNAAMGNAAASMVKIAVLKHGEFSILCVVTPRGSKAIWPISGMKGKDHILYVRQSAGTQAMSGREASQYERDRWN